MTLSAEQVTWYSARMQMQDTSTRFDPAACSRAGAHIYLSEDDPTPRFNGAVLIIATIIKFVMALAAKAELAALFIAACTMVSHRHTLIEMGWPQPRSPIQTDNSTAVGVTNKPIVPKQSKMMDMRL